MLGVKPSYSTGFAQWPGMSEYPQLWEGLVGAWDMSLGATGGRVFDLSGNGNTGTLSGPTWGSGKFGSNLVFGANKHVSIGTPAALPTLNVDYITIVTWIKVADQSNWGHLYGSDFNTGAWLAVEEDEQISFYTTSGGETVEVWVAISSLNIGQRYCLAAVFDGNYKYIYIDGVQVGSKALVGGEIGPLDWTSTRDIRIGEAFDGDYDFLGEIDQTLVYNRALSTS